MLNLFLIGLSLFQLHATPRSCTGKLRGPKVYGRVVAKPSPRYILTLTQKDARERTYLELTAKEPDFFEIRFVTNSRPRIDDTKTHSEAIRPFELNRAEFRVRSLLLAAALRLFPTDRALKLGFAWDSDKLNWDDFADAPFYRSDETWLAKFLRRRRFRDLGFDQVDLGPREGIEEGLTELYGLDVVREKGWFAHSVFSRPPKKIDVKGNTQPTNVGLR